MDAYAQLVAAALILCVGAGLLVHWRDRGRR